VRKVNKIISLELKSTSFCLVISFDSFASTDHRLG